ncbi:hypothetical protein EYF80_013968 [Liparis tanakae]|uniref:Secreted protein n=1 Tax=Liparis tanakae TaxID=230148 RepID=A0A4Z2IDL2_9TELE|nr:hypothetical protein EYF80_013968 [Liparis tanakae]
MHTSTRIHGRLFLLTLPSCCKAFSSERGVSRIWRDMTKHSCDDDDDECYYGDGSQHCSDYPKLPTAVARLKRVPCCPANTNSSASRCSITLAKLCAKPKVL